MNKNILSVVLVMLSLIFSACGSNKDEQTGNQGISHHASWPIFRGNEEFTGIANGHLPERPGLLWSYKTGYRIESSPVIGLGNVYIGSDDGFIYALDFKDGSLKWKYDTSNDVEAPPLLVDSTLFVGSVGGNFLALEAINGNLKWSYKTKGQIHGSANWVYAPDNKNKRILVGSYDNLMYCFEAASGKLIWTYETGYYINGAPVRDGKNIIFGGCDEVVHVVNALNGKKIAEIEAGSYIAGSAAVSDGKAYLGHYGDKLICVDLSAQKILWEYGDEKEGGAFFSSPAVNDKYVVIGCRDRSVHCVNKENGKGVWKFRTRDDVDSSPVICGDRVIVGSGDGRIYMLDINSGSEKWSYEIGAAVSSCPAIADGKIVIGADDGFVYMFGELL
jgi:outer membrane protein assembly factor BamB